MNTFFKEYHKKLELENNLEEITKGIENLGKNIVLKKHKHIHPIERKKMNSYDFFNPMSNYDEDEIEEKINEKFKRPIVFKKKNKNKSKLKKSFLVDKEIQAITKKFKNIKIQKRITDYCYNGLTYSKIRETVNSRFKILLENFPYTYLEGSKYSGILYENSMKVEWKATLKFKKVLKKHEKLEPNSKTENNCIYCEVCSSRKENIDIKGVLYILFITLERDFVKSKDPVEPKVNMYFPNYGKENFDNIENLLENLENLKIN